jgi:hypothetical protein
MDLRGLYCTKRYKKRQFDLQRSLQRELDLGVSAILSLAGNRRNEKSDGTVLFSLGDCAIGAIGKIGYYSRFSKYLLKRLGELGYSVVYVDEYLTSQMFPGGFSTVLSGENRIRIKYCRDLKIHINRDLLAGENMADIGSALVSGRPRPSYLNRRDINTVSQTVAPSGE